MPYLAEPDAAEEAVPKQRVGAYGVLLRGSGHESQMLLTRISPKDYGAGMWTLPGGGLDHGEDPEDGVVREFYEETSLAVRPLGVRFVYSAHFIGRNRAGRLEDFHGLSIVYDVEPQPGADLDALQVMEQDSSTDLVEWLTVAALHDGPSGSFDRPFVSMAQKAVTDVLGLPDVSTDDRYRPLADPTETRADLA